MVAALTAAWGGTSANGANGAATGAETAPAAAPSVSSGPLLAREFEFNASANRVVLTKPATHAQIERETGVSVALRGRLKMAGDVSSVSSEQRGLYLSFTSPDRTALDRAELLARQLLGEPIAHVSPAVAAGATAAGAAGVAVAAAAAGPAAGAAPGAAAAPWLMTRGGSNAPSAYMVRIDIQEELGLPADVDKTTLHQIRGKVLGPQGAFLKHMRDTTSARVHLVGQARM